MQLQHRTILGVLCGVGTGALWALVFLTPELASAFGPLELTIGRYLCFGLIAGVLIIPRWKYLAPMLGKKEWIGIAWLAVTGNILYYLFVATAVQLGGIAMTSLIVGLVPVAVSIAGSRESGAVPLTRILPSILLCIAGAVAIGWDAFAALFYAQNIMPFIGLLCAAGGLTSWTFFALNNRKWLNRFHNISSHDWNLLFGVTTGSLCLLLVPVALLFLDFQQTQSQWLQFLGASAVIAMLASLAGNSLWNQANRLLPFTMVGQMVMFETLFALLYAFAWEQRGPTINEAFAFAFVVGSVITCISAHRKPHAPSHSGGDPSVEEVTTKAS